MIDYALVAIIAFMWASTVVLAYGTGWLKGHEISEQNHRWSRWLIRHEFNRKTRL